MKAIIFPGQGSQALGMGEALYNASATVKQTFAVVSEAIGQDMAQLCFRSSAEELTDTANSQVAIFTVSIAVAEVLKHEFKLNLAKTFKYSAGHSLGEYTALCASGAIDIAGAAKLLKARGLAMKKASEQNPGAMCAVLGIDNAAKIEELITNNKIRDEGVCVIANNNSIGQIVLSGDIKAIDKFIDIAKSVSVKAIKLPVSGAFHSPLMQQAVNNLTTLINNTKFATPVPKVIYNVTATDSSIESINNNLLLQIVGQVKWVESINFAISNDVDTFVECGHGTVLTGLIKRINSDVNRINLSTMQDIESFVKTVI